MITFIDDHRALYGVESICRLLPIAPSTYYRHTVRRHDPQQRSTRARRDAVLKTQVSTTAVGTPEAHLRVVDNDTAGLGTDVGAAILTTTSHARRSAAFAI